VRSLAIPRFPRADERHMESQHLEYAENATDAGGSPPAFDLAEETRADAAGGGEIALSQAEGLALRSDGAPQLTGGVDGSIHDPDRDECLARAAWSRFIVPIGIISFLQLSGKLNCPDRDHAACQASSALAPGVYRKREPGAMSGVE